MGNWYHTNNWFCLNIGCPKCPYRQGYSCYYGNEDYEKYLKNGDDGE